MPKAKSKTKSASLNEDKVLYTKEELFERITLCLCGRVAEQHYLGTISTFSTEDLHTASRLAEKMMKNLGMGKLGNATSKNYGEKNLSVFHFFYFDNLLNNIKNHNLIKFLLDNRRGYKRNIKPGKPKIKRIDNQTLG